MLGASRDAIVGANSPSTYASEHFARRAKTCKHARGTSRDAPTPTPPSTRAVVWRGRRARGVGGVFDATNVSIHEAPRDVYPRFASSRARRGDRSRADEMRVNFPTPFARRFARFGAHAATHGGDFCVKCPTPHGAAPAAARQITAHAFDTSDVRASNF